MSAFTSSFHTKKLVSASTSSGHTKRPVSASTCPFQPCVPQDSTSCVSLMMVVWGGNCFTLNCLQAHKILAFYRSHANFQQHLGGCFLANKAKIGVAVKKAMASRTLSGNESEACRIPPLDIMAAECLYHCLDLHAQARAASFAAVSTFLWCLAKRHDKSHT